jgi:hypothetical protein
MVGSPALTGHAELDNRRVEEATKVFTGVSFPNHSQNSGPGPVQRHGSYEQARANLRLRRGLEPCLISPGL